MHLYMCAPRTDQQTQQTNKHTHTQTHRQTHLCSVSLALVVVIKGKVGDVWGRERVVHAFKRTAHHRLAPRRCNEVDPVLRVPIALQQLVVVPAKGRLVGGKRRGEKFWLARMDPPW